MLAIPRQSRHGSRVPLGQPDWPILAGTAAGAWGRADALGCRTRSQPSRFAVCAPRHVARSRPQLPCAEPTNMLSPPRLGARTPQTWPSLKSLASLTVELVRLLGLGIACRRQQKRNSSKRYSQSVSASGVLLQRSPGRALHHSWSNPASPCSLSCWLYSTVISAEAYQKAGPSMMWPTNTSTLCLPAVTPGSRVSVAGPQLHDESAVPSDCP